MAARGTRSLIDVASLVAIGWMWISIYESFTRSGLWLMLSTAVGAAPTLASELAVLAMCVLVGWLSLAASCWLVWYFALRRRIDPDFPRARLRT